MMVMMMTEPTTRTVNRANSAQQANDCPNTMGQQKQQQQRNNSGNTRNQINIGQSKCIWCRCSLFSCTDSPMQLCEHHPLTLPSMRLRLTLAAAPYPPPVATTIDWTTAEIQAKASRPSSKPAWPEVQWTPSNMIFSLAHRATGQREVVVLVGVAAAVAVVVVCRLCCWCCCCRGRRGKGKA